MIRIENQYKLARAGRTKRVAKQMRVELDSIRGDLSESKAQAKAAEQTHAEQRRLVDEAHAEDRQRAAAEALRQAERFTQLQAERDAAHKHAGQAREETSRVSGKLEALMTQNADLLAALRKQQ